MTTTNRPDPTPPPAEPAPSLRPVEEIQRDLATEEGRGSSKRLSPTGRLIADVAPLLDLLAAADQENAELRGELQAKNESALVTIIRVVSETYTDAGVLLWLNAKNRHLRSKPDGNHRCTPAEYIAAGYAAEVLEAARRIEGSL